MVGFLMSALAAGPHGTTAGSTSGALQLAPWQVINLVGAPALAIMFARPVIDDLTAWFRSRREER